MQVIQNKAYGFLLKENKIIYKKNLLVASRKDFFFQLHFIFAIPFDIQKKFVMYFIYRFVILHYVELSWKYVKFKIIICRPDSIKSTYP